MGPLKQQEDGGNGRRTTTEQRGGKEAARKGQEEDQQQRPQSQFTFICEQILAEAIQSPPPQIGEFTPQIFSHCDRNRNVPTLAHVNNECETAYTAKTSVRKLKDGQERSSEHKAC